MFVHIYIRDQQRRFICGSAMLRDDIHKFAGSLAIENETQHRS